MNEPKLTEDLVRAILGFPKYAVEYLGSLIVAILTDVNLSTLGAIAVLVGIVKRSVSAGLLALFTGHFIGRSIGMLADSIVAGFRGHAMHTNRPPMQNVQPYVAEPAGVPPARITVREE
jgi:hypothetical protein